MLKGIIFTLLFFCHLWGNEFYLNPYFEAKIEKGSKSENIIKDYVRFMNTLSGLSQTQKIEKVNFYINQIVSGYDANNYKNEEHWATVFEFLSRGSGDCEDYVIAKKYSLEMLGLSSEDMYFSAVKEKFTSGDHMVLSLHVDKTKPPIILDNLSTKVLSVDKRVDLETQFLFNDTGFYKLQQYKNFQKINPINLPAYEKMKKNNQHHLLSKKQK
jgi:predicted transglutaminase-like cysteine proteinase